MLFVVGVFPLPIVAFCGVFPPLLLISRGVFPPLLLISRGVFPLLLPLFGGGRVRIALRGALFALIIHDEKVAEGKARGYLVKAAAIAQPTAPWAMSMGSCKSAPERRVAGLSPSPQKSTLVPK